MAELKKKTPLYKVGDKVRTVTGLVGLVSAVHGTYSPTGHTRYSVHVPLEAEPLRVEVREEEIEAAPDADMPGPGLLPPGRITAATPLSKAHTAGTAPTPKTPLYKWGDKVRSITGRVGLVAEVHKTYSPTGHTRYSVSVPLEDGPVRLEFREEEIEPAPDAAMPGPGLLLPGRAKIVPPPDQHEQGSQLVPSKGAPAMPPVKKPALYKIGDKVRLKEQTDLVGLVSEVRETFSATGQTRYLVRVLMSEGPLMVPAREEDIEKV